MADLQQDSWLLIPAIFPAVQEIIEEFALQRAPIVRIEMRPVLEAVHFEPLFFRGGAHETLEIAARMQALSAPIGGRKKWRLDVCPDRRLQGP